MNETTPIRIGEQTQSRVTRRAARRHETVDETVHRARRQDAMAADLAGELTDDEESWLGADAE